jgi:hypothetical protein
VTRSSWLTLHGTCDMLRVMCSQIATKYILCQSIHLNMRTMQDVDADIIIGDDSRLRSTSSAVLGNLLICLAIMDNTC